MRNPLSFLLVSSCFSLLTALFLSSAQALADASVEGSKRPYREGMSAAVIPIWQGTSAQLMDAFTTARDERIYRDPAHPGARRAPWLFARNGCFARAAHVVHSLQKRGWQRPGKVFAFGPWASMRLRTPYDEEGVVWWSFHVASAFRTPGNRILIFDASVETSRPIPLEDWISRIAPSPERLSISFCDANAYVPENTCIGGSQDQAAPMMSHMAGFLTEEWNAITKAGHDPEAVLLNSALTPF